MNAFVVSGLINRRAQLAGDIEKATAANESVRAQKTRVQGISIASKLSRATMSAHFYLASLAAIGREQVSLQEI